MIKCDPAGTVKYDKLDSVVWVSLKKFGFWGLDFQEGLVLIDDGKELKSFSNCNYYGDVITTSQGPIILTKKTNTGII